MSRGVVVIPPAEGNTGDARVVFWLRISMCSATNVQVVIGNRWMHCPHFPDTPAPLHTPEDKDTAKQRNKDESRERRRDFA